MRAFLPLPLLLASAILGHTADQQMIPLLERNNITYVSAQDLAKSASIAVKTLPGNDAAVVVCLDDRCALVKDFISEPDQLLVSTKALADSLDLSPLVSRTGPATTVRFVASERKRSAAPHLSPAVVGRLAPNFTVANLEGKPVSLADFRGKRVLVNSWASW